MSSTLRIRPGHQDPLRRRTHTSAPTSASAPVTPPELSSSPAQLPIALCLCAPYLPTTINLPAPAPPTRTDQSQETLFSCPRNQEGARVNPETAQRIRLRERGRR